MVNLHIISVKGPADTVLGLDIGRQMGIPPTSTALTVSSNTFKCEDFAGFNVEQEKLLCLLGKLLLHSEVGGSSIWLLVRGALAGYMGMPCLGIF